MTEFAEHFGKPPDKLGLDELRSYQVYLLKERKLAPGSVVNHVAGLRFFFVKTLKRYQFRDFLPYPKDHRRLPTVLSLEEVARLINASGTLYRRTLLMTLYATGMRRAEVCRLKIGDIDSQRMIIRVSNGARAARAAICRLHPRCWKLYVSTGAGASRRCICSPAAAHGAVRINRSPARWYGSLAGKPPNRPSFAIE